MALLVSLFGAPLHAGGPTAVLPEAVVVKWDSSLPVRFLIDQGPLGIFSNQEGAEMVRMGFQKWEDVATATIFFQDDGFLPMDITLSNYDDFLKEERTDNPVIFDTDGTITDDLLGAGARQTVAGFTSIPSFDPNTQRFLSGFLVLNGVLTVFAEEATTRQLVIHEIGHIIGLDHTQAGHSLAQDIVTGNHQFVPIMYPLLLDSGPQDPLRDDSAWLSWLYPEADFAATRGTITGKIFRRTGGPFLGANVVAVQVDATGQESLEEVVSVVSDFLITNDGSYELPGLIPGDYVVFIEPLDTEFAEGSSVGPYLHRFVNFVKDYYNGAGESGDESDDTQEKMVISVGAGQTVENIDLISNETVNDLDALGDDDEMTFEFPSGFSFPFFGKTYTEVVVNSDGNLTFGGGDSRAGAARSEQRFLSGLPRIAPLFTDLDPGQRADGNDVKATTSDTEITFNWENVPEFSADQVRPGNHFSVTLFSNGDILFRYVSVDVTPDFPESDNLQAIVGITPGNSAPSSLADLSTEATPIGTADFAIHEVFKGSSFDLTGMQILFSPSDSAQINTVDLLFPFYQGNGEDFTGYALSNFSTIDAGLQVEGWGPDGQLLPFPDNPHSESVDGLEQTAKLGSEFFKISLETVQQGWVRIRSDRPDLASFFQFGNGLSGPLTQMDGSVAFTAASNVLYFTRLYEGPATFPSQSGFQDAETILHIANPNAEEITLTFKLFNPTGAQIGVDVNRTLSAQGMLFESVTSLFGLQLPVDDGFVRVDASGAGAVGFELIRLPDTVLGLNASDGNSTSRSYSAQLAHGTAGGVSVFTSLKVVNTANVPRAITITAYDEEGTVIGIVEPFILNADQNLHQTFQEDLGQILGLGFNPGPPTAGSILVEADGPGVIGDVIFGDPLNADFAAALPLQTVLFTKAVFSQVANGSLDPTNPSMNMFTGIALFNPNTESASVTVSVFDREGKLVGTAQIDLGPNQRLSDTVENLIPDSSGLLRGYITIDSTQPLVAQQLFGNSTLEFLSAVPPRIVE